MTAHCGVEDPVAANRDDRVKEAAFAKAFHELRNRISNFVELSLALLSNPMLEERLGEIGRITLSVPGETGDRP